ncbi:MAG: hypothetical protein JW983_02785 [Elusimicrobia bacterium]|nr:hypothetical protein [Elusimicrobiota bacterium]
MKKLIIKIGIIFFIVFTLQIIIYFAEGGSKHVYPDKIESVYEIIKSEPDIIYFGDSVVTSCDVADKNKKTLPEMLEEILKNKKVGAIENSAYHPEVFYAVCKNIVSRGAGVETVVIPINLRSFSTEWDMKPEYQFREDIAFFTYDSLLFRVFYEPFTVFKVFDLTPVSEEDYKRTPVYNGDIMAGRVKDFEDKERYNKYSEENMKNKLTFFYLYKLSEKHRKMKALISLAKLLNKTSVNAVFYLTPVDYETGDKFMGSQFSSRIKKNAYVVVSLLNEAGADVIDLSRSLPKDAFDLSERQYCNEHLNEKGRKFVARQVARRIKQLEVR